MTTPTPNQGVADSEQLGPWQEQLKQFCSTHGMAPPVYHIASDRRGGRTAWSSAVDVHGSTYNACFWYDGKYIENAKEDAANVAIERMEAARQLLMQQQQLVQQQQHQQGQQDQEHDGVQGNVGAGGNNWQGYGR